MGTVMIHCPKTGKAVSTGMHADRAAFGSMPVLAARCVRCVAPCTSGLPGAPGYVIAASRTVTRIARGGPLNARSGAPIVILAPRLNKINKT